MDKEQLLERLPHGSGFNGDWYIEEGKDKFVASNFYQVMNETGFYVGSADFKLHIPKASIIDFKLHFTGKDAQYLNRYYCLRVYLEDTIAESLNIIKVKEV